MTNNLRIGFKGKILFCDATAFFSTDDKCFEGMLEFGSEYSTSTVLSQFCGSFKNASDLCPLVQHIAQQQVVRSTRSKDLKIASPLKNQDTFESEPRHIPGSVKQQQSQPSNQVTLDEPTHTQVSFGQIHTTSLDIPQKQIAVKKSWSHQEVSLHRNVQGEDFSAKAGSLAAQDTSTQNQPLKGHSPAKEALDLMQTAQSQNQAQEHLIQSTWPEIQSQHEASSSELLNLQLNLEQTSIAQDLPPNSELNTEPAASNLKPTALVQQPCYATPDFMPDDLPDRFPEPLPHTQNTDINTPVDQTFHAANNSNASDTLNAFNITNASDADKSQLGFKLSKTSRSIFFNYTPGFAFSFMQKSSPKQWIAAISLNRDSLGNSELEKLFAEALSFMNIQWLYFFAQNGGAFQLEDLQEFNLKGFIAPESLLKSNFLLASNINLKSNTPKLLKSTPHRLEGSTSADLSLEQAVIISLDRQEVSRNVAPVSDDVAHPHAVYSNHVVNELDHTFKTHEVALLTAPPAVNPESTNLDLVHQKAIRVIFKDLASLAQANALASTYKKYKQSHTWLRTSLNSSQTEPTLSNEAKRQPEQEPVKQWPLTATSIHGQADSQTAKLLSNLSAHHSQLQTAATEQPVCPVLQSEQESNALPNAVVLAEDASNSDLEDFKSKIAQLFGVDCIFVEIAANFKDKSCIISLVCPKIKTPELTIQDLMFALTFGGKSPNKLEFMASGSFLFSINGKEAGFKIEGHLSPSYFMLGASLLPGISIPIYKKISISNAALSFGLNNGATFMGLTAQTNTQNLSLFLGLAFSKFTPSLFALSIASAHQGGRISLKILLEELLDIHSDALKCLDLIAVQDFRLHSASGGVPCLSSGGIKKYPARNHHQFNELKQTLISNVVKEFNDCLPKTFQIDPSYADLSVIGHTAPQSMLDRPNQDNLPNYNKSAQNESLSSHQDTLISFNQPNYTEAAAVDTDQLTKSLNNSLSSSATSDQNFVPVLSTEQISPSQAVQPTNDTPPIAVWHNQPRKLSDTPANQGEFILTDSANMRHFHIDTKGCISLNSQIYICTNKCQIGETKMPEGIFVCGTLDLFGYHVSYLLSLTADASFTCALLCDPIKICSIFELTSITSLDNLKEKIKNNAKNTGLAGTLMDFDAAGPSGMINLDTPNKLFEFYLNARIKLLFWTVETLVYLTDGMVAISFELKFLGFKIILTLCTEYSSLRKAEFSFTLIIDLSMFKEALDKAQAALKDAAQTVSMAFNQAEDKIKQAANKVKSLDNEIAKAEQDIKNAQDIIRHTSKWKFWIIAYQGGKIVVLRAWQGTLYAAKEVALAALKVAELAVKGIGKLTTACLEGLATIVNAVANVFFIKAVSISVNYQAGHPSFKGSLDLVILGKDKKFDINLGKPKKEEDLLGDTLKIEVSSHLTQTSTDAAKKIKNDPEGNITNKALKLSHTANSLTITDLNPAFDFEASLSQVHSQTAWNLDTLNWEDPNQVQDLADTLQGSGWLYPTHNFIESSNKQPSSHRSQQLSSAPASLTESFNQNLAKATHAAASGNFNATSYKDINTAAEQDSPATATTSKDAKTGNENTVQVGNISYALQHVSELTQLNVQNTLLFKDANDCYLDVFGQEPENIRNYAAQMSSANMEFANLQDQFLDSMLGREFRSSVQQVVSEVTSSFAKLTPEQVSKLKQHHKAQTSLASPSQAANAISKTQAQKLQNDSLLDACKPLSGDHSAYAPNAQRQANLPKALKDTAMGQILVELQDFVNAYQSEPSTLPKTASHMQSPKHTQRLDKEQTPINSDMAEEPNFGNYSAPDQKQNILNLHRHYAYMDLMGMLDQDFTQHWNNREHITPPYQKKEHEPKSATNLDPNFTSTLHKDSSAKPTDSNESTQQTKDQDQDAANYSEFMRKFKQRVKDRLEAVDSKAVPIKTHDFGASTITSEIEYLRRNLT